MGVELGVPPAELVLVGDAEVDVLGAHGAGVRVVLIREEREVSPEVRALGAHIVERHDAAFLFVRELTR